MKKTPGKIAFVLLMVMLAGTFTGCAFAAEMVVGAVEVAGALAETGAAIGGAVSDSAAKAADAKLTDEERKKKADEQFEREWINMSYEEREWYEKMNKYKDEDTF